MGWSMAKALLCVKGKVEPRRARREKTFLIGVGNRVIEGYLKCDPVEHLAMLLPVALHSVTYIIPCSDKHSPPNSILTRKPNLAIFPSFEDNSYNQGDPNE